ncbi:MAG: hypothetical protein ACI9A7_001542 [Cyclobacteriaceae bacterium]|jgi:hypothetical protein
MSNIFIDIFLCLLLYGILFAIILRGKWNRNPNNDKDDDDDGGILDWTPPKLDLPPGISLPEDPIRIRDKDEVLLEH